jgi:PAS domain S-box-containing protein
MNMTDKVKTTAQLITELAHMRRRMAELETLEIEYKRMATALRQDGERFRKIFDYSNDAIFIIDPLRNETLEANPKACQMFGYSREEFLFLPTSAIYPREMLQLLAFAQSVTEPGCGWINELTCLTKAGRLLPAEVSASTVDIAGRWCLIVLVRDITEHKRSEAEREQLIAQLQAALAKIKTLQGLISICASCKKIRDDEGYWTQIEDYIRAHSEVQFSHGICPDCAQKLYPEFFEEQ